MVVFKELILSWLRFLRISPLGVSTIYDRGVSASAIVVPGVWCPLVVTQTLVSFGISGRSRV